ncbi:DEAD/DEAH box helicase family protein [Bifidobacterium miconisargentati]|uniref:DEAD/DEAH box helicase family protein n=1 Tax=Bifidobacterium miconisargentati TaxID=2834437 RepID=UPI001BDCA7C5|nr:DEAD/DEAH box helicase family protein [Bifidobacterium miconisargentati]MBW3090152.1 DEAD/DEAH box helicase family protein [Bifidobacterium miconisargentati]
MGRQWGAVRFNGGFRDYQQHILDNADRYFADGRVHIVAPPGSGKTILGLELIRRRGEAALILSPTIAIADQWLDRFTNHFTLTDATADTPADAPKGTLRPGDASNSITAMTSADLHHPNALTSVTYQALHAAVGDVRQGAVAQSQALSALVDRIIAAGIRTICLDEAHHLRREWQKALEAFVSALRTDPRAAGSVMIIALTATPPYDAQPAEWERYITLCGDIDEEIATPELVKQGNLCPHQDFVMLNYPTPSETAVIKRYRIKVAKAVESIIEGELFVRIIAAAGIAADDRQRQRSIPEAIYDYPDEYCALMILMGKRRDMTVPKRLVRLVTVKHALPEYRVRYAQQAFQFVIRAPELFGKALSDELKKELTQLGVTDRGQVALLNDDATMRWLVSSAGKLDSIARIVRHESSALGERLRLLVLTDYIRADAKRAVGGSRPMTHIGVVPIFETLRRMLRETRKTSARQPGIAVISGSLTILPASLRSEAFRRAAAHGVTARFKPLNDERYCEVDLGASNGVKIAVITELFEAGLIQVLIGTKSLLGEGWDSPSINTLILASTVGSFMLTNQMRGRAIRAVASDPGKVANVWHLATAEPEHLDDSTMGEVAHDFLDPPDTRKIHGEDFIRLTRRFDCFIGPSYVNRTIESGIGRLDAFDPPFDRNGIERINDIMLRRSADRGRTAELWHDAVDATGTGGRVTQAVQMVQPTAPREAVLLQSVKIMVLAALWYIANLLFRIGLRIDDGADALGVTLCTAAMFVVPIGGAIMRWWSLMTPKRTIFALSCAMLNALREMGSITSAEAVSTVDEVSFDDEDESTALRVMLIGGSRREQVLFAKAMNELLAPIGNPRYVIIGKEWGVRAYGVSFACPDAFSRRQQDAEILRRHLNRSLTHCSLVYTRTEEGRHILLRCRTRSFLNLDQHVQRRLTTSFHCPC